MTTTYDNNLRVAEQETGDNSNTWGTVLTDNAILMLVEAISGLVSISVASGDVTLTTNDGTTDQSRPMFIKATGSPGTARVLTAPAVSKLYAIWNASDSVVTIKTSGGTAAKVAAGQMAAVFCDGTDFYRLGIPSDPGGAVAFPEEYDNGNSGTAKTIDWGNGNKQKLTLTGNVTLTFAAPAGVGHFQLRLVQDATGSRTVTWPTIKTPSGAAVSIASTAADETLVSIFYNGTDYYVSSIPSWSEA